MHMPPVSRRQLWRRSLLSACLGSAALLAAAGPAALADDEPASASSASHWTPCGWGGGGFFYDAAYHPTKDGVIYMAGDVGGVYKTVDHARTWRIINNGLANYGVFSLAVDPSNPDTVYAATEGGLCKSVDQGEHWTLLPQTGPKDLGIVGVKGKSFRCVAVDPKDGNVVYAGTPHGKVYKSVDGGQSWKLSYTLKAEGAEPGLQRVQYGKVREAYFGDLWGTLKFPDAIRSSDCVGLRFEFKGDGSHPQDCYLHLKSPGGVPYRSRNLNDLFADTQRREVILRAADFEVDPEYAAKNPDTAKNASGPDWETINRLDLSCSGPLLDTSSVALIGDISYALTRTPDGQTGTADKPLLALALDMTGTPPATAGNIRIGEAEGDGVFTVAVSPKNSSLVGAATPDAGLLLSRDGGGTWTSADAPKRALSVAFDPVDPDTIYGAFAQDGIWKSTDGGKTWAKAPGLPTTTSIREVDINPLSPQNVYAIGTVNFWGGYFFSSDDGGKTWKSTSSIQIDHESNPTLHDGDGAKGPMSTPTNIAVNPTNPKELFISANWRPILSEDGGLTWTERDKGADISVITDIRFHKDRTYVTVMDEGTLVSENAGANWRQLWPLKADNSFSGHNWRIAITDNNGADHLVATVSPWANKVNLVVVSDDGGKTIRIVSDGLPKERPQPNTMWGEGYARALAVDPNNPKTVYLGIDGDPSPGKMGGGIFKSEDGGSTWNQLPNQPKSRRMFYGLAVDPTDSKRLFWATCGPNGGVYRSQDGGASWQSVFTQDAWIFNLLVSPAGVAYAAGKNLWRSTDHGATWKQLTKFAGGTVIGMDIDPRDPNTMWISATSWNLGSQDGGVFKTTDGGATWQDITGDLPYRKPMVLRFNPLTSELWVGGTEMFKIKQ